MGYFIDDWDNNSALSAIDFQQKYISIVVLVDHTQVVISIRTTTKH